MGFISFDFLAPLISLTLTLLGEEISVTLFGWRVQIAISKDSVPVVHRLLALKAYLVTI